MSFFKEHQYLLMRRESRDVLGRKAVNLWLLVLVLTATFFAIAFSAGSKAYLEEKMNDPFTNWVNINRTALGSEKLNRLKVEFEKDSIRQHFLFDGVQTEINSSLDMLSPTEKTHLFSMLYYEDLGSDLIAAVLSEENVIDAISVNPDSIDAHSFGVIMTADAVKRLGYDYDHIPAFVDCNIKAEGADTLGFKMIDNYYVRGPLPLLAVVKRLPMNKDIVASKYFYQQYSDDSVDKPFNMNNEKYVRDLRFFVPDDITGFQQEVMKCIPDSLQNGTSGVYEAEESVQGQLRSWKKGHVWTVYHAGTLDTPISAINAIEKRILDRFGKQGVQRVYAYKLSMKDAAQGQVGDENSNILSDDDVISAHFYSLDSIRSFERFVKDVSGLQIEMSQVNSKMNFWAVSDMANILTFAMIVFSIICIIVFVINMLQSYFQKVRRNLGTFKAFGISTNELTRAYVAIIISIVVVALAISLILTWLTELLLPVFGCMKDGEYSFLLLWNTKTVWAIVIILVATVFSVLLVMRRLLRQTPGNLIYDR